MSQEWTIISGILKNLTAEKYGKSKYDLLPEVLNSIIDAIPDDKLSPNLVRKDGHIPLVAFIQHFLEEGDGDTIVGEKDPQKRWELLTGLVVGNVTRSDLHTDKIILEHIRELKKGITQPLPAILLIKEIAQSGLLDEFEQGYTINPDVYRIFGPLIK